jgi:hypothetical protein
MSGQYMRTPSRMAYVTDGRDCIGQILSRGRAGFEALDREQCSLGLFETEAAAARAVIDVAANERGAG